MTTRYAHIKKIIRDYFEQFYANKLDNIYKMNKSLERQKLSNVTQEKVDKIYLFKKNEFLIQF